MDRVYLDHASTSPLRPVALDAMTPWLTGGADPGRIHHEGRVARGAVEDARSQVAELLGARPREVVFTSGATESIASAVWGAAQRGPHMVVPAVEHSAVRDSSARYEVSEVGVDIYAQVDPDEVLAAIAPDSTSLVHLQWANHEVGTIQPVAAVAEGCRRRGVLFHVDAAAAVGHVPVDFADLGADLLSLSAHKFGGPAGIGALVVRRGLRLAPLLVGGEQERARRAGLENVAAIVGFGAAAASLSTTRGAGRAEEADRARRQTKRLTEAALAVQGVEVYGHPSRRVPHIVCLGVGGVEAEAVLIGLDQSGVAAHSGSACSSESLQPSPVLAAMGVAAERSLRLSVGWSTTDDDIEVFARVFPAVVSRLRSLRS